MVVCLDQTGSMEPVHEAARAGILRLLRRLKGLAPRLRLGLVTYDDEAFLRLPLTADEALAERTLKAVPSTGGGDEEEGVDKAVLTALRSPLMGWSRKAQRVVVVVGDAPPHEDDVHAVLAGIRRARDDPLFEVPVRVDTISALEGVPADERVPRFREIAEAGRGSALRLERASDLVEVLLLSSFGPTWREPIAELLRDLAVLEADRGPEPRGR
jgi:Mg-chelatase subunit ChlD